MSDGPSTYAAGTTDIGGDLTVNRLGFGAIRVTGRGIWGEPADRGEAVTVLRRAVELGVDFIDTADSYGPDVSESLIAEALSPYPDDLVIATKGGLQRPGPNQWTPNGRPEHLRAACDGSLRRLRLEQIPLYQFHRPDPNVPIADSIGALVELHDEGKIRHIGLSNVSERQLRRAQQVTAIVSIQNRYNVSDRGSDSLLDLCEQEQITFIPWAPIQDVGRDRGEADRPATSGDGDASGVGVVAGPVAGDAADPWYRLTLPSRGERRRRRPAPLPRRGRRARSTVTTPTPILGVATLHGLPLPRPPCS